MSPDSALFMHKYSPSQSSETAPLRMHQLEKHRAWQTKLSAIVSWTDVAVLELRIIKDRQVCLVLSSVSLFANG